HRDIKPANILLEDAVDRLLITDFGLARTVDDASLTHTGVVAGTPSYMSPEQATGDEVDHRTDLFSLGSVLYYAATGHPPFRAERTMGVLHRICHQRHRPVWQVNAAVPDELSDVIDRLLEKRRSKRFAGATAVADTLTRILHGIQHRRPGMLTRLTSWGRRHRPVAVSTAALLLVAIGLATWSVWWPAPPIAAKRVFDGSTVGQPSLGMADATSQESGVHGGPLMAVESLIDRMQTHDNSPPSAMGDAVDTNLFPPTDRVEFDRSLSEVTQSLNSIESVGPIYEMDSFSAYQQEVRWLEQTLKSIDPTIPPKKM
ncbi:MAG: serine/threonine protein kinase, partial [Pirellulaceae bacterium]|nr:serine/threonine protein kinase [Pirellulaceae bacterium]